MNEKKGLWRYIVIGSLFAAVCIVYIAMFINLQVSGQDYYSMSTPIGYKTRTEKIEAQRGEIYDRNGNKLVENEYSYELLLDYSALPTKSADKNAEILKILDCISSGGDTDKIKSPLYYPFNVTVNGDSLSFEFNENFLETTKAKKFKTLVSDLGLDEKDTIDDAAKIFMKRYGIIDTSGKLLFPAEEAKKLFEYRLELELVNFSSVNPYVIAEDISLEAIGTLGEAGVRGYTVSCNYERKYTYPGYASHILGQIGKIPRGSVDYYTELGYPMDAVVGTSGAEAAFEKYLHGVDGEMTITEDSFGNIVKTEMTKEPVAGCDVYLTIDIGMQIAAEDSLAYNIEYVRNEAQYADKPYSGEDSKAGALTAVKPNTGEVLVLASYPTYDLSTFLEDYTFLNSDETAPMLNRALMGTYQPGSTFKPGVAVAGLDTGCISPWEYIDTKGEYTYYQDEDGNGYAPRCWLYLMFGQSHGPITVTEAIQESCNYFFYETGRRLTIETMNSYSRHFGLGESTGIELQEKLGVLAGPDYRNDNGLAAWVPGDTLQAAIGQSDNLFTPLQMSMYLTALVNNGDRYSAHILSKVCAYGTGETVYEREPEIVDSLEIEDGVCDVVLNAMKDVIENGSASELFEDYPIVIGGKTGTAQVSKAKSDNAIFTAFAPFDDPEIVTTCVIEQGNTGANAGVAIKGLFDYYFEVDKLTEDDEENTDNEAE